MACSPLSGHRFAMPFRARHDTHQAAHTMPTCMEPIAGQISCDLATAEERVFREDPINLVHQFQRLSIHTDWRVIKRRPANLQQLALLGQAQVCAVSVDQLTCPARLPRS